MLQNPLHYCLLLAHLSTLLWKSSGIVAVITESESLVPLLVTSVVVLHVVDDDAVTCLYTLLAVARTIVDFPRVPLTVDDASLCVPNYIPNEFLSIHLIRMLPLHLLT
jgi:hypothetical protein